MTSLVMGAVGAGLIGVSTMALWHRRKFANCPRERRPAGKDAAVLAWFCLLGGIGLVGFAFGQGQDANRLLSAVVGGAKRWVGINEPPPHVPPALSVAEAEEVVDRLIAMGYLKFVDEPQKNRVRGQLIDAATQRHLDNAWDDARVAADRRGYPAAANDLAKGKIGATILLMKPVLEREGVKFDSVEDEFVGDQYRVVINGEPHVICEGDAATRTDAASVVLHRLLAIVNDLLDQAGSRERLFVVGVGESGRVTLLTDEMQDYIESIGDVLEYAWIPRTAEELHAGGRP